MNHTPEPWAIFDMKTGPDFQPVAHIGADEAGRDLWIGQDHTQMHDGSTDGDARRIVACVNACRGYKTEELEDADSYGVMALRIALQRDTAIRERDEARAMVAELAAFLRDNQWGTEQCIACGATEFSEPHSETCRLMSLIAKAKAIV